MGDAAVEGAADDGAAGLEHVAAAEIVPEAEGDGRQIEARTAAAAIGHGLIAAGSGFVAHERFLGAVSG